MCTYTVKTQRFFNKLKKSSRGVRDSTERPKIRRLRRKGFFFYFFIFFYKFYSEICTKVLTTIDHIAFGVCKNHS